MDDMEPLEEIVGKLLMQRHLTLALAESCTGGLIAHKLTNISGSSAYFMGGVVCYSNEAKRQVLGVKVETINEFGAVSEETAREMAFGARRIFGTDIALAVTGIAGPTGGSPQKPVGLTFVALSTPTIEQCERYVRQGSRWENKEQSAEAALRLLHRYLKPPSPSSGRSGSFRDSP